MGSQLEQELDNIPIEQFNTSGLGNLSDPGQNAVSNLNGLSGLQRGFVKNFFDTQPKRRAAYLRRLGFEVSKDGEKIRPLGRPNVDFEPIEEDNTVGGQFFKDNPEGTLAKITSVIPFYNLFTAKGIEELGRDFGDIAFDLFSGPAVAAAGAAGAVAGGAEGSALGGAVVGKSGLKLGGIIGTGVGALVTGAAANRLTEEVKKGIGDMLLDESVPLDQQEALYQSLFVGGLGAIGTSLGRFVKNWQKLKAKDIQSALKDAVQARGGGNFNKKLADDLALNPQKYTPENVKGANKRLLDIQDEIFGTSVDNPHTTKQLTGGVARGAINPLNSRADIEVSKLSQMAEANFAMPEIRSTIKDRLDPLISGKFLDSEARPVLRFLNKEMNRFEDFLTVSKAKPSGNISLSGQPIITPKVVREATFEEARAFLKGLQNKAFQEGPLKGNRFMTNVTHGLKEAADAKAGALGSDLPAINAQRSNILSIYKNMTKLIKDGNMRNAFVGNDRNSKERVVRLFTQMDEALDTNLGPRIKDTQFQATVENLFENPNAFGSGSVVKDLINIGAREAKTEAIRFGTVGAAIGATVSPAVAAKAGLVGAGVGATKGFVKGARIGADFASPGSLIKKVTKVKDNLDDIDAFLRQNPKQAAQSGAFGSIGIPTTDIRVPVPKGVIRQEVAQPVADAALSRPDAPTTSPIQSLLPELEGLQLNTSGIDEEDDTTSVPEPQL